MPQISALIQHLRDTLGSQGQLAYLEATAGHSAQYGDLEKPLVPRLQELLSQKGLRLYSHQAEAIDLARRGKNVILASPTASGKSLAFNVPVWDRLLTQPFSTALYIYPLKALANDQLKTLLAWDQELGANLHPAIYDGDTPAGAKRQILGRSRLILTNPYALHEYAPWHHLWRRFFLNLRYVIIDEAHIYRGIFGSHIACLLRRLQRIFAYYHARPTFILSSATLRNATQFAETLVGRPFCAVTEDGSPHGPRLFLLWNPGFTTVNRANGDSPGTPQATKEGKRRSPHLEVRDLVVELVRFGLQTICFSSSRAIAELLARWTREQLAKEDTNLAGRVAAYRAGYLAEDRRRLETQLRSGELRAVFSTNALELGIDIGSLDAVVMAGYPGTMISVRQQAGRAGRGLEESLAMMVAFPNPLDQYFIQHPDRFFGRPLEEALLNPSNPYILRGHLQAAGAELPWRDAGEAKAVFGTPASTVYEELENEGFLSGGRYRGPAERASAIVSLENIGEQSVQLLRTSSALGIPGGTQACPRAPSYEHLPASEEKGIGGKRKETGDELLETMDLPRAIREAYPGAIFLHQGETYRVESLDLKEGIARARPVDVDMYTSTRKDSAVRLLEEHARRRTAEGIEVALGEVEVTERILGFFIKRFDQVLDYRDLNLPPLSTVTQSAWFRVPASHRARLLEAGNDFDGALHALEHATIALVPLFALCDRWDLGGVSYPEHPTMGGPVVFLHEGVPGGVGIAEKIYQILPELLEAAMEMIRSCPCENGCPSCVLSPKCGNNNQPMSKAGAILLLEGLLRGK
ncbi:MAG: DEAD/DEAH box helicase [Coprothermobacterota bacterium]|nr:DEAD/DEAH box helicase [Coprothermobacterota bacterium]